MKIIKRVTTILALLTFLTVSLAMNEHNKPFTEIQIQSGHNGNIPVGSK